MIGSQHPHNGWFIITHNPSPKESNTFLWPPRASGAHMVHMHTCRETHTRNKKKNQTLRRKFLLNQDSNLEPRSFCFIPLFNFSTLLIFCYLLFNYLLILFYAHGCFAYMYVSAPPPECQDGNLCSAGELGKHTD